MDLVVENSAERQKGISNGILGMVFLLTTEAMFFAGLISAFVVNKAKEAVWPPVNQPRLPIEITGINTVILLLSAVFFYLFSKKALSNQSSKKAINLLWITAICGFTFLAIQGYEWIQLLGYGLTSHASTYGGFFYLIIGAHGVHVLAGLGVLFYLIITIRKANATNTKNTVQICGLYWYFVVLVWPVLYYLVYLT